MQRKYNFYYITTIDYYFLFIIFISFITLPFYRFKLFGYFIPLFIFIAIIYNYIKIILSLRSNLLFVKNNGLIIFLFLFVFFCFISTISAHHPNWRDFFEITFYIIITFTFTQFVELTPYQINKILNLLYIVTLFLCFIGIYNFLIGKVPWFQFTILYGGIIRGERVVGSRNVDVYLILFGFIISITHLFLTKRKLIKLIYLISLVPFIVAVFLSFSRGGFFSLFILSAMMFLISSLLNKKYKTIIFQLVILVIFLLLIENIIYDISPNIILHFIERWQMIEESKRLFLMKESLELMIKHPLLGIGLGNYKFYTQMYEMSVFGLLPIGTAHNSFLNFGAETGILGFLTIILLIFYPLYHYLKLFFLLKNYMICLTEIKFIYCVGLLLSFYLILINFFDVFYIDAAYVFWIPYILCMIIYNSLVNYLSYGHK